jgi:hypothetical protein
LVPAAGTSSKSLEIPAAAPPPAFSSRQGVKSDGRLGCGELDRRYIQHLSLAGLEPEGELGFAPAFKASGSSDTAR